MRLKVNDRISGESLSETALGDEEAHALVRRAQAGDEAAFEHLVRRFYDRIYRWALVRTSDPDDAEDVTQQVLVNLHRGLLTFDGRAQFSTWLYRVVTNASSGFLRGRLRWGRLKERVAVQQSLLGGVETPEGIDCEAAETRAAALVGVFLEQLPRRQREVFDLVDLQGYEPVEVSRMLELRPVTVRTHLLRARRALRRKIIESHPELVEGYSP